MPNKMHADWLRAKANMEKQVAEVKKQGGLNPKQIEDALKGFDGGFGPLLEKLGTAYKANKGADVTKHATEAITVAQRYLHTVQGISNERGRGAALELKILLGKLDELKTKGMTCAHGKEWLGL
jgi:hypothetical protein